jgi:hypothetical protein
MHGPQQLTTKSFFEKSCIYMEGGLKLDNIAQIGTKTNDKIGMRIPLTNC